MQRLSKKDQPQAKLTWDQHGENFIKWVKQTRPEVVVANSNSFPGWLEKAGYRIPENISFVSLGVSATQTSKAGIDQNQEIIGAAAIDLIVGQCNRNEYGLPHLDKTVLIRGTWVQGNQLMMTSNSPRR